MQIERSSGVLLHPTSFPGKYGIGDLGEEAYTFVDFLEKSGMKLWQTLAIGPTGYADSPYSSVSAFAGNHLLINPEKLIEDDDLSWDDIHYPPPFPRAYVDFGWVIDYKEKLFHQAAENFANHASNDREKAFKTFCEENDFWLDDFSLFMAIKKSHNLKIWNSWEQNLIQRDAETLKEWRDKLSDEIYYTKYVQWQFWNQWQELKEYANSKDIQIIGDIPIFVAEDSADVWSNPELFYLEDDGQPTYVAGVPPDYFSATGQRWGNPLYNWDVMKENDFSWWTKRVKHQFKLVDILRIDHFRGFEAFWRIPSEEETAINGEWIEAPGRELFQKLDKELGKLPIIAEDLGVITEEVEALRNEFDFPGMKVLQFAFEGADNFLPHNIERNFIVYTGTHDNDTSLGWYQAASEKNQDYFRSYTGSSGDHVSWDFIRYAFLSQADMAVIPLQDLLELGTEARMNTPGVTDGNWNWRFWENALTDTLAGRIKTLVELYER